MSSHLRPLIIAHRGGSPGVPENSAAAFAAARATGVDMLECDVRRSADGVLILIHDGTVRIAGRRLLVGDTQLAELREAVPSLLTLDEFLERFGSDALLNVDIKGMGYEAEVVDALRRHGVTWRAIASSQHTITLRRLARLEPGLVRGLSRGHLVSSAPGRRLSNAAMRWWRLVLPIVLPISLRLARANAAMLQHGIVTPGGVRRLHRWGVRVFAWTVDDADEAVRLRAAGVDGIASNVPERIIAALRDR